MFFFPVHISKRKQKLYIEKMSYIYSHKAHTNALTSVQKRSHHLYGCGREYGEESATEIDYRSIGWCGLKPVFVVIVCLVRLNFRSMWHATVPSFVFSKSILILFRAIFGKVIDWIFIQFKSSILHVKYAQIDHKYFNTFHWILLNWRRTIEMEMSIKQNKTIELALYVPIAIFISALFDSKIRARFSCKLV